MREPPAQFFEFCSDLLARRCAGGKAEVESKGLPYELNTLNRWVSAAILTERESQALARICCDDSIDFDQVRNILTMPSESRVSAPPAPQPLGLDAAGNNAAVGEESWEWLSSEGDITIPEFPQEAEIEGDPLSQESGWFLGEAPKITPLPNPQYKPTPSGVVQIFPNQMHNFGPANDRFQMQIHPEHLESADPEASLNFAPGLDDKPQERFKIAERLVRTRIFDVHAGRDLLMGRKLNLHVHRREGPINRAEFIAAVRRQARLQHPNIQPVYELGLEPDGLPFYATAGGLSISLHSILKGLAQNREMETQRWTRGKLLETLFDISQAIVFAHKNEICHRDVRPCEVFLGDYGQVELAGWFRSRHLKQNPQTVQDAALNEVGHGLGYLPPERLEHGLSVCNCASDIWGLGALLYGILTFVPPFSGRSSADILRACADEGVIPPSERIRHADVPQFLEDLCLKALVIDPQKRTLTASEFARELQTFLEGSRAEERRLDQAEEILSEAEQAARRYMEAREHLHLAWRAEAEARGTTGLELKRARAKLQVAREEAERWFHRTEDAYTNTMAALPRYEPARRGLCALYFRALQDVEQGQMALPSFALEASIRQTTPHGFTRFFHAPASLEIRCGLGADLSLWSLRELQGILSPSKQRAKGRSDLIIEHLAPGAYVVRVSRPNCIGRAQDLLIDLWAERGTRICLDLQLPNEMPKGMVYVPAGPCALGLDGDEGSLHNALPGSRCSMPSFFAGQYLVTMGEYMEFLSSLSPDECMQRMPRRFEGAPPLFESIPQFPVATADGLTWTANCPAVGLSYDDVQAYIAWRSARDHKPYRLLTELEWEKLARGASGRRYPWGNRAEPNFAAVAQKGTPELREVGSAASDCSVYGAFDLAGCAQEYTSTEINGKRIVRGGSWNLPFSDCISFARSCVSPSLSLIGLGFRLALDGPDPRRNVQLEPVHDWLMPVGPEAFHPAPQTHSGYATEELTLEGRTVLGRLGPAPAPRPDWSQETLDFGPGRYQIMEEIARGSMGRVVLAFDKTLERHVALKILHDKHQNDQLSRYRFAMEARITGRLQHPTFLPMYDMGMLEGDRPFFAMKPVEGQSLQEIFQARATGDRKVTAEFTRDRLLTIMRRICQGVAFANQQDIIHRDLKPANILVGSLGEILIVDLGLARQIHPDASDRAEILEAAELTGSDGRVTRVGSVIGTPYYMSPEQAMGLQDLVGPQSDVYGLGAILYHLLTHRPPFSGKKVNEVLAKVRKGNPLPPSQAAPQEEISPKLDQIVLRALSLDPHARPQDALELAEELGHVQETERLELQVREIAQQRAAQAIAAFDRAGVERKQLEELTEKFKKLRQDLQNIDPSEHRTLVWQSQAQLEQQSRRVEHYIVEAVSMARLALDAGYKEIRPRLAVFLQTRYLLAEASRDQASLSWYGCHLRRLDETGQIERWLEQGAAFQVDTRPSGMTATIKRAAQNQSTTRLEEVVRRGSTPLVLPEMPQGSGVCILGSTSQSVRIPFQIQRSKPVSLALDWPRNLIPGFAYISEGNFLYGGNPLNDEGQPPRLVRLPSFQIAIHPVTCFEYQEWLEELATRDPQQAALRQPRLWPNGPSLFSAAGQRIFGALAPYRPITGISLADAHAYANWRSRRDNILYRLPSSAEWEKAARGVDGRSWPWGNAFESSFCRQELPGLCDVGTFPDDCSPYGVQDIASGVMEWTMTAVKEEPNSCYLRGGCSALPLHSSPCSSRRPWNPNIPSPFIGFRLATNG